MEVDYELTREDLYAFQWRAAHNSPMVKRTRRNVYLYLFLALFLFTLVPAITADGFDVSRVSFGFLAFSFAVVAALTWFFERRQTRRAIHEYLKDERPDKGQLGRHKLALDDAGLVETTAVGESRTSWPGVHRVEQNEEYIFIYTAPAMAHVIPRRAFGSALEAESFLEHARARVVNDGTEP